MVDSPDYLPFATLPNPLQMTRGELVRLYLDVKMALRDVRQRIRARGNNPEKYLLQAALVWTYRELDTILAKFAAEAKSLDLDVLREYMVTALTELACVVAVSQYGLVGFLDDPDSYRRVKRLISSIDLCETVVADTPTRLPSEEYKGVFASAALAFFNLRLLLEEYLSSAVPPKSFSLFLDLEEELDEEDL